MRLVGSEKFYGKTVIIKLPPELPSGSYEVQP
jgi:hypothetical protein